MPASRYSAAQKLAILEEADRALRCDGGKAAVAAKYGLSRWALVEWARQRKGGRLAAEIQREREAKAATA